jgi:hypothetical protein
VITRERLSDGVHADEDSSWQASLWVPSMLCHVSFSLTKIPRSHLQDLPFVDAFVGMGSRFLSQCWQRFLLVDPQDIRIKVGSTQARSMISQSGFMEICV